MRSNTPPLISIWIAYHVVVNAKSQKKGKKEIPNFEYIENIGIWNEKKKTHNFNGIYVGKGYYCHTLIGEEEEDKDDDK